MLPDYPKAKKELGEFVSQLFKAVAHARMLDIRDDPVLEGDTASYTREDGTGETLEFAHFGSSITISDSEYLTLTWPDMLKKVGDAASQMGDQMFGHMLEKVDAITEQTGNRVDVGGNLTPEKFIALFKDRIKIPFDADGNPAGTIVAGEEASKAIKKVLEEINSRPDLRKQYEAVVATQKERWCDRESHRKLVD